ncbi:hydrolase 1, exosortase A system-associated [Aestuariibacter halophilus]|uniref:Hydrolase 1, exosortase A system-associated n=1 Tax=Fluctibacter halophilus TaxID=226011 RepID=A0ABS8G420_9ALTE|nr:hydrolase 1, exosortase A system-associated [Aestuariibacter halophilus]MCC2614876.1 hydrolase 1, exosortase A system-associated [Aestuariibacter halophilus]
MTEQAFTFQGEKGELIGISHHPQESGGNTGVLIVVGGPQTRVGSHRQFVLLARHLAEKGLPCMRFDYYGMGDSEGREANFLHAAGDIDAAIRQAKVVLNVDKIALWGLCDAASSMLLWARQYDNDCVSHMVLLNPWARSEQGEAKTLVKHYYLARLKDRQFWRKVLRLEFDVGASLSSLTKNLLAMRGKAHSAETSALAPSTEDNYISHMLQGLRRFTGDISLIISGQDLTAAEFEQVVADSTDWQNSIASKCSNNHRIDAANHTFSSALWRDEVATKTEAFIKGGQG